MPADNKSAILAATDIVEVIAQTVALKRRGRDFVGLCPFHQEKTGSFYVRPDKQVFFCHGCKVGGSVIDFVMRRDRLEFLDALRWLADRAGIEMQTQGPRRDPGRRATLLAAMADVDRMYRQNLASPVGLVAREYLTSRGLTQKTIDEFGLGLALPGWDNLARSQLATKYPGDTLMACGLVKARGEGDGVYDVFRARIIFPIRDEAGRTIAFGGRILPGQTDPAKYLNSPETELFSKSRAVYGLDRARDELTRRRWATVVEGYMDVVACHQAGAPYVVSCLGTSLTEQHVAILRRFVDKLVIIFDADSAGDASAERTAKLFLSQGIDLHVAGLPKGLDPDEFILKEGAAAFEALGLHAPDALEFAYGLVQQRYRSSTGVSQRQQVVKDYVEMLGRIQEEGGIDPIRWGEALGRVAHLTQIPAEDLRRQIRPSRTRPVAGTGAVAEQLDARGKSERWVIGALLAEPALWKDAQGRITIQDFADQANRDLAARVFDQLHEEGELVLRDFVASLPGDAERQLALTLEEEASSRGAAGLLASALTHFDALRGRESRRKALSALSSPGTGGLSQADESRLLGELQGLMSLPKPPTPRSS